MKYLVIALASAALTGAQTPAISIRPSTAGLGGPSVAANGARTGIPALGYLAGPGPLDLRMLVGTAKAAQVGDLVALPKGVKRFFLPPREHYLLLESSGNDVLAVWSLTKSASEGAPLAGATAHPDMVAFSARGDASLLYTRAADRPQVVIGLPAEPSVTTLPPVGKSLEVANFALSDDGAIVAAQLTDGTVFTSVHGAAWQRFPIAYDAQVMLFAPRSHNLVVSNSAQQTISFITGVDEGTPVPHILAQGVAADCLAFTKEGAVLLAASSSQKRLWTVDVKTMTSEPGVFTAIDTLIPLRDGHTFLLSASSVSLLTIPAEGDPVFELVPVTR